MLKIALSFQMLFVTVANVVLVESYLDTASTLSDNSIPQEARCLNCIRNVSSMNIDLTKRCEAYFCGPFQLSYTYWAEAGKPGNNQGARDYEKCARDKNCAQQTVRAYFRKFKRDCNNDGIIDCRDMAALHKAGPTSCSSDWFYRSRYWVAFNKTSCMTNQEDPSESKSDPSDPTQQLQSNYQQHMKNQSLTNECLDCICDAVSGCNTSVNNCGSGTVCGPFAISQSYWKDGRRPGASWTACTRTKECSCVTIKNYMEKYKKDCNGDGVITCEDYAALHRRGPRACMNRDLYKEHYWNKFLACRANQKPVKDANTVKVDESPGDISAISELQSPIFNGLTPVTSSESSPVLMATTLQTTTTTTTTSPTFATSPAALQESVKSQEDTREYPIQPPSTRAVSLIGVPGLQQTPIYELKTTVIDIIDDKSSGNGQTNPSNPYGLPQSSAGSYQTKHVATKIEVASNQPYQTNWSYQTQLTTVAASTTPYSAPTSKSIIAQAQPAAAYQPAQPVDVPDYAAQDFPLENAVQTIVGNPNFPNHNPPIPDIVGQSKPRDVNPSQGVTSDDQIGRKASADYPRGSNPAEQMTNGKPKQQQSNQSSQVAPKFTTSKQRPLQEDESAGLSPGLENLNVTNLFALGLNDSSRIASECLECICDASSNCDTAVQCISKQRDKNRCGLYMISWNQYQESDISLLTLSPQAQISEELADERMYYECATDRTCAERLIHLYIEKHQKDCNNDGKIDCLDIAAIHRVGPGNCNSGKFLDSQYWRDFKNCYTTERFATTAAQPFGLPTQHSPVSDAPVLPAQTATGNPVAPRSASSSNLLIRTQKHKQAMAQLFH